jgi:alpha,alpha-trehalose phosphorylase
MIHRERLNLPRYIYPIDEWKIIEKRFHPEFLGQMETLFALSNGYLGMRGTFEEGTPSTDPGNFVNGFYESWPIIYGEEAFGFAKTGQTIVNLPDLKIIRLFVDDEPFFLPTADLKQYERVLDMQSGTLRREIIWQMASGILVSIKTERLVSFEHRHLAAISYEIMVLNTRAPVVISSEIVHHKTIRGSDGDPRHARLFKEEVLKPEYQSAEESRLMLGFQTRSSRMRLACGVDHDIASPCPYTCKSDLSETQGKMVFAIDAQPEAPVRLTKYMTYHTSRSAPVRDLVDRAERTLTRGKENGFEQLLTSQKNFLGEFWRKSDVRFESDPQQAKRPAAEWQQAIHWNLFQLLQASVRAEGVGIPAKGLTGEGYEGHYFWDIEIYVLPFLIYTEPRIARNLLKFRHSMLPAARQRAREVNQKGALFPWRTITGDEASAYYAAGTAQYHINADIVYALKKYVEVTGDMDFLYREGAEILVETARLWRDLGFFSPSKGGKFCIHAVTGPDEYNTVVDNNTFTNLMARENLRYASRTVGRLRHEHPQLYRELQDKTSLEDEEIGQWEAAAENMYIPYHDGLGIHPQDDSFLDKKDWDFEGTPLEKYPLLLHYHPLVIYRHKVIKQADLLLAIFLLGNEFSPEQKRRNFDFYDRLTTGDSSLSVGIQSIVAAEVGDLQKAAKYAVFAVLMDLADVGGNVSHGCHIASIGATWMVLVYGLAGMRDHDGRISFMPRLVPGCARLHFSLSIRNQLLEIEIRPEAVTYVLAEGSELTIQHDGNEIRLSEDTPKAVCPGPGAGQNG